MALTFSCKVQERLFPQRTAEARELLKQGMRIGGPMSRVPGEPMTSYISRRRRWWTLVHEMDNTLELGDTVQGSMMLEQAGLCRFEQNMVLTYTKGQRTMTAIAEALLEQHYDVHHRGRETPTPTGKSSSPNRWRHRDTSRAYLAEAEPIKELTDTAAYGEEGISDDYDGERDETEDDEIHETDLAALLDNSGEDPEADDALAEALLLYAVATVAWQRFNGKGKGKGNGKGKVKGKGKGKYKGKQDIIVSESISNSDPIKSLCCVLLEQHGAPECFRTTAATVAGSTNACHGCGCGWKRDWPTV